MKVTLHFILLFVLLIGCKKEDKLTVTMQTLKLVDCPQCARLTIEIPSAQEKTALAMAVNRAIKEEIIALLLFEEDEKMESIRNAMKSFQKGFVNAKKKFGAGETPWEGIIKGKLTYEDSVYLTIVIDSYLFTGGAHGYVSRTFLNFDKNMGKELEAWELFKSKEAFEKFAEQKFREKEAIPADKSINHTGLMFEDDRFYLPENIGFTQDGVQLRYNPYEVASYADGAIVLTLPFKEVRPFLAAHNKS